jgi:hypothetical protein
MRKLLIVACIVIWLVAAVLAVAILTREDGRDNVTFLKRAQAEPNAAPNLCGMGQAPALDWEGRCVRPSLNSDLVV